MSPTIVRIKNLKTLVSPDWKWWVQDSSRWVVRLSASTVWWEFSNVVHWKINILFVDSKKDTIDYNIGLMSTLRKICWWYLYKKNLKNVQIVYIQCTSSLFLGSLHIHERLSGKMGSSNHRERKIIMLSVRKKDKFNFPNRDFFSSKVSVNTWCKIMW